MYCMLLDQRYHSKVSVSNHYQNYLPSRHSNNEHTSTCPHGLRVVVGNIVVNPHEIRVRFLRRVCRLQVLQSTSDHAVSKQTWEQSDLQREPILRLPDVEDVAAVRRASCGGLVGLLSLECAADGGMPWLSWYFSMSSCVRPNCSHSAMCKLISCRMCVTIAAPWTWSEWVELSLSGCYSYCGNVIERCRLVACQSVGPSKLDLCVGLADAVINDRNV